MALAQGLVVVEILLAAVAAGLVLQKTFKIFATKKMHSPVSRRKVLGG
jgi:hypothetical protein